MKMQPVLHRLLVLSSCFTLFACQKDIKSEGQSPELSAAARKAVTSEKINTFKGPQVEMGDGKARSWITISHEGVPQEIGIEMTAEAVMSMPTARPAGAELDFLLPLHQKAQALTPFDHIVIDWNPGGHPPPGIFTVPHFDFHFYMISVQERLAIAPTDPFVAPPASALPPGYVSDQAVIPAMGSHWVPASVFAPGYQFTDVMVYGSYGGKVTFLEPMITRAELTTHSDRNVAIVQPAVYGQHGVWYPTAYNYYHEGDKYYVTLSNFVWVP